MQFEPVFSAGNERHVHHMIVSECSSEQPSVRAALEQLADTEGGDCHSEAMIPLLKACAHTVVAWAVGSQVRLGLQMQSRGYVDIYQDFQLHWFNNCEYWFIFSAKLYYSMHCYT